MREDPELDNSSLCRSGEYFVLCYTIIHVAGHTGLDILSANYTQRLGKGDRALTKRKQAEARLIVVANVAYCQAQAQTQSQ